MKTKKNVEYRVVCCFGMYGIYKCVVDEDGDVINVGDNLLAKEYPSYSSMLQDLQGMLQNASRAVAHVTQANRKIYGV